MKSQVLDKEDNQLPDKIKQNVGADIFYRNLKNILSKYGIHEDSVVDIILDIFNILKTETIVDWHKNNEVKRVITNKLDDYLYEIVKIEKDIQLNNEDLQTLLSTIIDLASSNHEIFHPWK